MKTKVSVPWTTLPSSKAFFTLIFGLLLFLTLSVAFILKGLGKNLTSSKGAFINYIDKMRSVGDTGNANGIHYTDTMPYKVETLPVRERELKTKHLS